MLNSLETPCSLWNWSVSVWPQPSLQNSHPIHATPGSLKIYVSLCNSCLIIHHREFNVHYVRSHFHCTALGLNKMESAHWARRVEFTNIAQCISLRMNSLKKIGMERNILSNCNSISITLYLLKCNKALKRNIILFLF